MRLDPVQIAQQLIRLPSVTPQDAGAMDLLQGILESVGFRCRRLRFGEVENLYARYGDHAPNLCFAGHTDVVPPGDVGAWRADPFAAEVQDGALIGRGAVDMKGAIGAYVAAAAAAIASGEVKGSLSFLITGDEEGAALDGTRKVVETLLAERETIDHCLVGEPSSVARLGDVIKIGRRGSVNAWLTVLGTQGHVAYPERAKNPIPVLLRLLDRLATRKLDEGYTAFAPSNLEITSVDVANPASNVIPAEARARFNIRFNPSHTGAQLIAWIEEEARALAKTTGVQISVQCLCSGDAFLTEPSPFVDLIQATVESELGVRPDANTLGGTSDARFIRAMCPVVELGLVGQTMHQVDEQIAVSQIEALSALYLALIRRYFETDALG